MIAAAIFHLPYGCMAMDLQAFYMLYRPGSIPPGLRVATDVPKSHNFDMMHPHYVVRLFLWT